MGITDRSRQQSAQRRADRANESNGNSNNSSNGNSKNLDQLWSNVQYYQRMYDETGDSVHYQQLQAAITKYENAR